MRVAIILNPRSGTRLTGEARIAAAAGTIARVAESRPHELRLYPTERARHAAELARHAVDAAVDLVVAWGGDGTVNEVASALAFTDVPLAIIPAGSGNGLARALRIPPAPEAALLSALDAQPWPIDVGEAGGRLFVNVAGLGFDAHVAHVFNAAGRARRGLGRYVQITARELWRYRARRYVIEADASRTESRAIILAVANSPQYGNGALIAPGARLDDGRLDLVMVESAGPVLDLWRARRLFTGTLDADPRVSRQTVVHLRVRADEPILYHVDGEPVHGDETLEIRVHAKALRMQVPRVGLASM